MITEIILVGLGGFIGTVLRYEVGLLPIYESSIFPTNTLIINVIGAFLIGLITTYVSKNVTFDENLVLFLKVGICGGFTTFSAVAMETGTLIKDGDIVVALVYIILSTVLGVIAVFIPELLIK